MDTMLNFLTFLKSERAKLGFTQDQFAELLGISLNTLKSYEYGRHKPSIDVASNICQKLGVPLSVAVGEIDPSKDGQKEDTQKLTTLVKSLQAQLEQVINPNNSNIPADILRALESADELDLRSIRNILDLPIPDTKRKAN